MTNSKGSKRRTFYWSLPFCPLFFLPFFILGIVALLGDFIYVKGRIKKKGRTEKLGAGRRGRVQPIDFFFFFLFRSRSQLLFFFLSFVLLAWKGGQFSSSVTVPSHRRPSWSPIVSMSIAPAERERIFAFSLFRYDAIAPSLLLYYIKSNNSPFYIVLFFFSLPFFRLQNPFFLMMDQMSNHIFPWKSL